jgi:hypothetical protein
MRFWGREIIGWLLVFIGLGAFYVCFEFLLQHHIVEACAFTVVGFIVFRGGIHLVKVAVAARICLEARAREEDVGQNAVKETAGASLSGRGARFPRSPWKR